MNNDRLGGFLELARQYSQRFTELEQHEWKLNYSVWALLAGSAYLLVNHDPKIKDSLSWLGLITILAAPAIFHGIALFVLHGQMEYWRRGRNHWRDQAVNAIEGTSLDNRDPALPDWFWQRRFPKRYGRSLMDWIWLVWELMVTFGISAAGILLWKLS